MQLGKVIGSVVSTRKNERLESMRLLIVEEVDVDLSGKGRFVVATDGVEAGPGEIVLFCQGSSARQSDLTDKTPVDALIMAIVDSFDLKGEIRYEKYGYQGDEPGSRAGEEVRDRIIEDDG
ncbi:MAG: EutN/CcmL family microcompartment protein [Planctomycetes bacterium]|nr:EutN/CcmL family microcompartment protein [Planctomycetota bacterium]